MMHPLSRRITDVLALETSARAIQFDGQWSSWGRSARWRTGSATRSAPPPRE